MAPFLSSFPSKAEHTGDLHCGSCPSLPTFPRCPLCFIPMLSPPLQTLGGTGHLHLSPSNWPKITLQPQKPSLLRLLTILPDTSPYQFRKIWGLLPTLEGKIQKYFSSEISPFPTIYAFSLLPQTPVSNASVSKLLFNPFPSAVYSPIATFNLTFSQLSITSCWHQHLR